MLQLLPFFVPNIPIKYAVLVQRCLDLMCYFWWQIGSFGAITRILNIVSNREDLLKVAAAGPLAGFSLGLVLLLLGFLLPPADGIGVVVDASVFHDSLLAGGIGKHFVLSYICIYALVHPKDLY